MSKICGTSFIDEHPRPGVTCTNTLITYAFTHVLMPTRQKNRARVAARDAYTYHIDEFPPESAVGRCFDSSSSLPGSARVQERERDYREGVVATRTERNERQADKDGDKGAWERDRQRERTKKCEGKKRGSEGRRLYRGTESQKKTHRKHEGTRRRKVAEGSEQKPLIQREIRERREETVKTVESNKYLDWKGERGD